MRKIAAKVKGDQTCALQLELVVFFESSDDGLGVLAHDGKVIDVHAYVLVVVVDTAHPDVGLSLAQFKTHFMQTGSKLLMPSPARRFQTIKSFVDQKSVTLTLPELTTANDLDLLFGLGLQVSITNVRRPRLKSVEFGEKEHEPDAT